MEIERPPARNFRPFSALSSESNSSSSSNLAFDEPARKRQRTECPPCQPWSREDFFARVKTFGQVKWFGMPVEIGPYECARHGWTCIGQNYITCTHCQASLSVNLNNHYGIQLDQLVKHFQDKLSTAHQADCPWRSNPSPPEIAALSVDQVQLRTLFLDHHKSWANTPDAQKSGTYTHPVLDPETRERLLERWWQTEQNKEGLVPSFEPSDIVLLAACGWRLRRHDPHDRDNPNPDTGLWILECRHCDRKVNLAAYDVQNTSNPTRSPHDRGRHKTPPPASLPRQRDERRRGGSGLYPTEALRAPVTLQPEEAENMLGWAGFGWPTLDLATPARMPFPRIQQRPPAPRNRGKKRTLDSPDSPTEASTAMRAKRSKPTTTEEPDTPPAPPSRKRKKPPTGSTSQEISKAKRLKFTSIPTEEDEKAPPPARPLKRRRDVDEDEEQGTAGGGYQKRPRIGSKIRTKRPLEEDECSLLDRGDRKRHRGPVLARGTRTFHPFEEHRFVCPYVRSTAGNLPGWEEILEVLPKNRDSDFWRL